MKDLLKFLLILVALFSMMVGSAYMMTKTFCNSNPRVCKVE